MEKLSFKEWSILSDLETIAPLGEDFEFSMARGELKTAKTAINRLMRHLKGEGDLEAWVQSKITKASEYLDTVADHMDGGEDDTEKKEVKESKEAKKCPDGKYWCMTDKKCKKIPKGWHMMRSGRIMKDDDHEEEENKNGNGNGEGSESNGGGVSEGWSEKYKKSIDCDNPKGFSQRAHCQGKKKVEEQTTPNPQMQGMPLGQKKVDNLAKSYEGHVKNQLVHGLHSLSKARESAKNTKLMKSDSVKVAEGCGSTHETKKKKKKLSEMISTSSTGGKFRDISSKEEQDQLDKERSERRKERSEKYKAHLAKLRGETRERGVRFYDKKGSGYIRDGKKVYDESAKLDEKCWDGYKQLGMKKKGKKVVPNCVKEDSIDENKSGDSSLRDWFTKSRASDGTPGWVQLGGKYAGKPCAKQPGQTTKPKCGSSKMKRNLNDEEEQRAFRRKNRQDPNPDRKGKAKNVATESVEECPVCGYSPCQCLEGTINEKKDACYSKVKSRYSVWPSAYASGALVKCRKVGAKNWGNKTKKEGYELSNWRDDFKPTEYEVTDLVKPEKIKFGYQLADSVIYPGQLKTEDYQKLQSTGNVFTIMLMWRGKTYRLQLFFSGPKRPSREEVKAEIQKFYPGGVLTHYYPSPSDPTQPIVVIQR